MSVNRLGENKRDLGPNETGYWHIGTEIEAGATVCPTVLWSQCCHYYVMHDELHSQRYMPIGETKFSQHLGLDPRLSMTNRVLFGFIELLP